MPKVNHSEGEVVIEAIAWCAREASQVTVKRTILPIESNAMLAVLQEKWLITREKLEATHIPEGWNIKMASGMSRKTTPSGNTAHWSMVGRKLVLQ